MRASGERTTSNQTLGGWILEVDQESKNPQKMKLIQRFSEKTFICFQRQDKKQIKLVFILRLIKKQKNWRYEYSPIRICKKHMERDYEDQ